MSVTTNVIAKEKQAYYNAGSTSNAVSDAVDDKNAIIVGLNTYGDNAIVTFTPTVDVKLTNAVICTANAVIIANTSGNAVVYTVSCNGVSCATLNCEADLAANIAVNSTQALTVNSSNGDVDAGEVIHIGVSTEAAADSNVLQTMTLHLERR